MENESVVEKLNVKLLIHGSVVQQVDRALVVLALVEPSTGFCHGIADLVKVEERVRRRATVAGGKRKFHCNSCNYSTKDNYLLKRHIARIREKSVDSKRCRFCKFQLYILQTLAGIFRELTITKQALQFCVNKHQILLVLNNFN